MINVCSCTHQSVLIPVIYGIFEQRLTSQGTFAGVIPMWIFLLKTKSQVFEARLSNHVVGFAFSTIEELEVLALIYFNMIREILSNSIVNQFNYSFSGAAIFRHGDDAGESPLKVKRLTRHECCHFLHFQRSLSTHKPTEDNARFRLAKYSLNGSMIYFLNFYGQSCQNFPNLVRYRFL